jgi:glutathione synthase/RimK-type ligase-like ATP-grasp enzyme
MKKCAYLVMDDPGDFVTDYHLSFDAMADAGWQVECVPWRNPSHDWSQYDAVYICTPWDYPDDPALFMRTLEAIEASPAHLINPISLARWSLAKTYLRDLAERGGAVVPSLWFDHFDGGQLAGWFDQLDSKRIIVKPEVGTNSQHQVVLSSPVTDEDLISLQVTYQDRPFFVQPFIDNVQSEGEYSLFFFDGVYSHAILKTPEQGDFRSQEEHGAEVRSADATAEQIDAAEKLLSLVEPQPTYVRVDLVRDDNDNYLLMELELIEPSLYLRTDSDSSARFARAFDQKVQELEAQAQRG